jgi:hypothetical protein
MSAELDDLAASYFESHQEILSNIFTAAYENYGDQIHSIIAESEGSMREILQEGYTNMVRRGFFLQERHETLVHEGLVLASSEGSEQEEKIHKNKKCFKCGVRRKKRQKKHKKCSSCVKSGVPRASQARYCSEKCQKEDWRANEQGVPGHSCGNRCLAKVIIYTNRRILPWQDQASPSCMQLYSRWTEQASPRLEPVD